MPPDERPPLADPPPVPVNEVAIGVIGTAIWGVAAVVLALLYDTLARHHITWWLWTAVTGFGLGIIGTVYLVRRRRRG